MLGVTFGNKHSYNDWGIWLEDSHKNPPLPKRYIVDVPARNGLLELTPELTPIIRFENRTLTFNFRVKAGDWSSIESMIYGDVHGKTLDVVSDLDPNWHWHGCVTVDDFASDERTGVIVITVDAYPFKLSNTENSYTVNGNGTITCVVDRMEISPAFELTAPTTVIYGDSSYAIESTATTEKTLSGDIVSFVDGTANPAVDLTADIDAVQSGSGDPSPENIRPISGWDEVNVTRTGKNLFGLKLEDYADAISYGLSSYKSISVPNGVYTISTNAPTGYIWGGDKIDSGVSYIRVYSGNPHTITVDAGLIFIGILTTDKATALSYNIQIERGSTATAYEPYNGQTYTIDLDGTRYGGTLDVTTGVLTLTHGIKEFDGTESFTLVSDGTTSRRFTASLSGTASNGICSHGIMAGSNIGTWGEFRLYSSGNFAVLDGNSYFADVTSLKSYLTAQNTGGTPLTVCYELATPQVVQLTPQEVKTLAGENNIWVDSGEVEVTYIAQDFAGRKFFIPDLELTEGSHTLTIQGTGTTKVTYTNGRL